MTNKTFRSPNSTAKSPSCVQLSLGHWVLWSTARPLLPGFIDWCSRLWALLGQHFSGLFFLLTHTLFSYSLLWCLLIAVWRRTNAFLPIGQTPTWQVTWTWRQNSDLRPLITLIPHHNSALPLLDSADTGLASVCYLGACLKCSARGVFEDSWNTRCSYWYLFRD